MGPAFRAIIGLITLTLKLIGKPKSNLQTMTENLSGINLLLLVITESKRTLQIL